MIDNHESYYGMYAPGHIGAGLLVSTLLVRRLGPRESLWAVLFAVIGARFPDIDTLWSIDHHGLTHTLVGAFVTSILLGLVIVGFAAVYWQGVGSDDSIPITPVDLFLTSSVALFLGQLSHIGLDCIR